MPERPIARMPGLTSLIEDQNKVLERLQAGSFSNFRDYNSWMIRAASLSLGKWPRKYENVFENRHIIGMIVRESPDYDQEMGARLLSELSKVLIDIFQEAQASVIPKMMEEDTTDRVQRRKMEGIA